MAWFSANLGRRKPSWLSILTAALTMLSLSSLTAALEKTQADYFVSSLPGQPAGELLKMHAG
jgi:carboxypeptidase D